MTFLFSILLTHAVAQKRTEVTLPAVPVDSITKLITYEGVIEVKGASAEVLYDRITDWFKSYYKNPSEVIRENDTVKFRITGKPRFKIHNPEDKNGLKTDAGLVQYTITVASREGRFKYELSEFNWKQLSYFACERWLDKESSSFNTAWISYLEQLDAYSKEVISSLKNRVTKEKIVKDRDNW